MIKEELINCTVEALVLASPEPVSLRKLSEAMNNLPAARIRQAVADLNNLYMGCGNSFRIREVAGGYQVHILPDFAQVIKSLLSKERTVRLTRAALETLAIIAYKQPVTKIDIEHIRGVSSDGVLHNLLERKLIVIAGRAETPGRPLLYKTANEFLKFFGLNRISDLPRLEEIEEMIREAEPSRDQTEIEFAGSENDVKHETDLDTDAEGIDPEIDDDMVAHVQTGAASPDTDDDKSVDRDRDGDESDDIPGADFDPDSMAERDARTKSELSSYDDGGNGNGSPPGNPALDEDSATAIELVFGGRNALTVEREPASVVYLPTQEDLSADDPSGADGDESPGAYRNEEPDAAESGDRRVSDE